MVRRDSAGDGRRLMARPVGEPASPVGELRSTRGYRGRRGAREGWAVGGRGPREPGVDLRRWIGPLVLVVITGAAIVLLGGIPGVAQPPPSASPEPSDRAVALPSPSTEVPAGTPSATGSRPPATPTPTPSATVAATPTPTPTRPPGAAPASAREFDTQGDVVIAIAFPFKPGVRYRYRDNWLDPRPDPPEHYNHVRGPRRGELVRAHDGIDVYARLGTPVVAPFAGMVIVPAERWQPWHAERYGVTVVIVSQEPLSEGYHAILSHLDQAFVEPGDVIRRGEVIGLAGTSGNAEDSPPHVHFELRAPFMLEWREAGRRRIVDAFNPYASLRAADPDGDE